MQKCPIAIITLNILLILAGTHVDNVHAQVTTETCAPGNFQCMDGNCLDRVVRCDHVRDCTDGSDEMDCDTDTVTTTESFYEDAMPFVWIEEEAPAHHPTGFRLPFEWEDGQEASPRPHALRQGLDLSSRVQEDDGQLLNSRAIQNQLLFPSSVDICSRVPTSQTTPRPSVVDGSTWFGSEGQSMDCGESLTGLSGGFHTPGYPSLYPRSMLCSWFITAPVGYTITLTLDDFDLEEEEGLFNKCKYDYVAVYDNYTLEGLRGSYCGHRSKPLVFNSASNVMTVVFRSDHSIHGFGFIASFTANPTTVDGGLTMASAMTSWPIISLTEYVLENDTQMSCVEKFFNRSNPAVHALLSKICCVDELTSTFTDKFDTQLIKICRRAHPSMRQCKFELLHGCVPVSALSSDSDRRVLELLMHTARAQCRLSCHVITRRQCAARAILRVIETVLQTQRPVLEDCLATLHSASFKCVADGTSGCEGADWLSWYVGVVKALNDSTRSTCEQLQSDTISKQNGSRCNPQILTECFNETARAAAVALFNGNRSTIYHFHKKSFPDALKCLDSEAGPCEEFREGSKNVIRNFVDQLVPKLTCNATEAQGCVKMLETARNEPDLDYTCRLLEVTERCVEENLISCTQETQRKIIQKSLSRAVRGLTERCKQNVQCVTKGPVILKEGGSPVVVEFKLLRKPSEICGPWENCKVFFDFYPQHNGSLPKCGDGRPMKQFGIYTDDPTTDSCTIEVTDQNWDKVKTVRLAAKVDYLMDGTQRRQLNIVLRRVRHTQMGYKLLDRKTVCTQEVEILDSDHLSSCMVVTDPEIFTFDWRYYVSINIDDFYMLYRHKELPIEVHAAFQSCSNLVGSCACAVAVRAYDSVFYMDKCETPYQRCSNESSSSSSNRAAANGKCSRQNKRRMSARDRIKCPPQYVIYTDKTTPTFRLYSRGDDDYEVLLPHGGRVKINDRSSSLNIYIIPSPYDRSKTQGLCGTYDGVSDNDLEMRNGSLALGEVSVASRLWGRVYYNPDFVDHWRVEKHDWLTDGVQQQQQPLHQQRQKQDRLNAWKTGRVCDCEVDNEGAARALCYINNTLELCNFNTDRDITNEMITKKPKVCNLTEESRRVKRSSPDSSHSYTLAQIVTSNWTFDEALDYCTEQLITDSEMIKLCSHLPTFKSQLNVTACAVDIMLTGSTDHVEGMSELLKERCDIELTVNETFSQTDEGLLAASKLRSHLCRPACNTTTGTCEHGRCKCLEGYTGSDCSQRADRLPTELSLLNGGLCDSASSSCSSAQLTADLFTRGVPLQCHIQHVLIGEENVEVISATTTNVSAVYLHRHLVACRLPPRLHLTNVRNKRSMLGYFINMTHQSSQSPLSDKQQLFVPYDSRCHVCTVNERSPTGLSCVLKEGVCLLDDGVCLEADERSASDECFVCRPSRSQFKLYRRTDEACSTSTIDTPLLIIILMLAILFVVVIATVAVVIVSKKRFGNVAAKFNLSGNNSNRSSVSGSGSPDSTHCATSVSTLNLLGSDSIALSDISSTDHINQAHINTALQLN